MVKQILAVLIYEYIRFELQARKYDVLFKLAIYKIYSMVWFKFVLRYHVIKNQIKYSMCKLGKPFLIIILNNLYSIMTMIMMMI